MEKSVLIHVFRKGHGGLGDFLRAVLTLYTACVKEEIDYYIDLSECKSMECCFTVVPIPENIRNIEYREHHLGMTEQTEDFKLWDLIRFIKEKKMVHRVISNAWSIKIDPLIAEKVRREIIFPSMEVQKCIETTLKNTGLNEKEYYSLHIRTGDRYIDNGINGQYVVCDSNTGNEINIHDENMYKKIHEKTEKFISYVQHDSLPIIIHSDSKLVKKKLCEMSKIYRDLDLEIIHVANNENDETEDKKISFISTIAEFYIMGKSNGIIMSESYSGFPHLSSIFGNTKLYICPHTFQRIPIELEKIVYEFLGPREVFDFFI